MHMSSVRTIEDDGQVSGEIHDCTVCFCFCFFFSFFLFNFFSLLYSIKGSWFLIKN